VKYVPDAGDLEKCFEFGRQIATKIKVLIFLFYLHASTYFLLPFHKLASVLLRKFGKSCLSIFKPR